MWVSLSNSFLSIVENRNDPTTLCVRARAAGDIERVFPDAKVLHTPKADYQYRTVLPRAVVAGAMVKAVAAIDYDNFKNSVAEADRHDAYLDCWVAMSDFQAGRLRGSRLRK